MSQRKFLDIFKRATGNIIGMVHVHALPGSPRNILSMEKIQSKVMKEAETYLRHDVECVMLENMHDVPYLKSNEMGPEVTASMASLATSMRQAFPSVPIGIQILTCGHKEALAVAKCTGLDFVRVEGYVFSHIGDEGWIDSCAGQLLRYRKTIQAENVLLFTDIKKKHSSHAITEDISLTEAARAAEFFLSDGVIITGSETGIPPHKNQLKAVQDAVDLPVIVGSGVTVDNVEAFKNSSAMVVGSHFKEQGSWMNDVDPKRVQDFMAKIKFLR